MSDSVGDYVCAYCGQYNDVAVDRGGSAHQVYVEDCQVCCKPNVLHIDMDLGAGQITVHADRES